MSLVAPEEHMLCISPAQCYQEQKAMHRNLFSLHLLKLFWVNVRSIGCLENLLLFFLKMQLCRDFQIRGLLCAAQPLKLFWAEPLALSPVSTGQTESQDMQDELPPSFHVPAFPPQDRFIHLALKGPGGLLNLQLLNFPFCRGSWAGSIPTWAFTCWGHSPSALCRAKRKWKCWNKHFGTASWLG